MKGLFVLVLLLAFPAASEALEGTLQSQTGTSSVLVWKSQQAMDEGLALIRAQAAPHIIAPLLACAPKAGTRVVYTADTQGSMWSGYLWPVTIVNGPFAGCRGFVPSGNLNKK